MLLVSFMNHEPPLIDHNPYERKMTNRIWWIIWPIIGLQWVGYLYFRDPDWWSLALGGMTLGVLATWAIEITGNKVPSWMSGLPPRVDRDF